MSEGWNMSRVAGRRYIVGSESESGKVVKKGVPLQLQDRDILSESELESGKVVGKGVPLQ